MSAADRRVAAGDPGGVAGHGGDPVGGRGCAERGSGVLGMSFGVFCFLGFLLMATQITASMYARTVVRSAALDAGRIMARAGGPDGLLDPSELHTAGEAAGRRVQELLGPAATFQVASVDRGTGHVTVTVRAPGPRLLPGGGTLGPDVLERTVRVRLELLR